MVSVTHCVVKLNDSVILHVGPYTAQRTVPLDAIPKTHKSKE